VRSDHDRPGAGEGEGDMAPDDPRMGVVDEDVRPQVECALDVVGDGDADALATQPVADVAADLAPRDGPTQDEPLRPGDRRNERASDGAEGPREADSEWLGDDGTGPSPSEFLGDPAVFLFTL